MKKVAIYPNVSTDGKQGNNYNNAQIYELRRYAEDHDMDIVVEYIDIGYSGTTLDRPGLQRLFEVSEVRTRRVFI